MKASEVIEALQRAMAEVGDVEVYMPAESEPVSNEDENEFAEIYSVVSFEKGRPIILCDMNMYDMYNVD